ncbi:MAG TPA: hypothetical protein VGK21_16915, partial [Candidatus Angelobacter sp.]
MNLSSMDKDKRSAGHVISLVTLAMAISLVIAGCGKGEKKEAPEVAVQAAPAATADISRVVNTEGII